MERRNFLIGIGAASAGGGAVLGSGAFSRVESDRYVTIEVAGDPDAYLGLDACDSSYGDEFVDIDDSGHLYVDIGETGNGGEGVNSNSRTWFDDLIQLCNQGTDDACVWVDRGDDWPEVEEGPDEGEPRVDFYLGEDDESILGEENAVEVGVGECECIGIRTNTHGIDATAEETLLEEVDDVVTLVADVDCPDGEPGPGQAFFEVSDLTPTAITVGSGGTFDVSATITNAGDAAGEQDVDLLVDGEGVATESASLGAGGETIVSFEDVGTGSLDPGEYSFGVYTDDDSATGSLTVGEAGPFSVEDAEGMYTDVIHEEDGRVGRYMYEYDPSTDDSLYNTFKPFLHVFDPATDQRLTADPRTNEQFAHHRGIFIGWNEIEAYGESVDNWHEAPTVHQGYDPSLDAFDEEQALTSETEWLTEEDGDVFVTETREMSFEEPQTDDGVVIVDTSFTLEFETDVDLYGDPEHGGIQYRAHGDVGDNGSAEYYFSDYWDWGENPGQGTVDQEYGYDWVAMEATMHDDDYLVVQMNHPDNPVSDQSTVSAYRDYGRFGYFWEDSFEEGDEITVEYRFVIERGGAPDGEKAAIDEWFADYVGEQEFELDDPLLSFDDDAVNRGTSMVTGSLGSSYPFEIEDGEVDLSVPDGWEIVDEGGTTFETIDAFGSQDVEWELDVPDDAEGEYELTATIAYAGDGRESGELEVSHTVDVRETLSAPYGLNAGGVSAGRGDLSPGDTVEVGGVEFEPYTDETDLHPAVTLVGDHSTSGANDLAQEIEGTDADAIYQTMMFGADIGYEIDVEPGTYAVTLHLAEIYWGEDAPGGAPDASQERIYSAWVQGEPAFEELHLYEEVGELVAHPVTVEVVVEEGESLVIETETHNDNSMFNAVEIRESDAYVPENPVSIPYGLNAGGVSAGRGDLSPGDIVEINGVEFEPYTDEIEPHPGVTLVSDHNTSGANGDAQEIEGTDADEIYQTMMWSEDEMGYEIEAHPGTYDVTFHLAEIYFGEDASSGAPPSEERIYSAWVNGEPVFEDLNLWADHGELVARSFTIKNVEVEDGPIEIELVSSSENPMVNAIEIRESDAYVPENPVSIPYGLNAGGVYDAETGEVVDETVEVSGVEFEPYTDEIDPHPGVTLVSDHNTSSASDAGQEIAGTDADAIYQTMMWSEDEMGYEIEVVPGTYEVTLHLAEIFQGEDAVSGEDPDEEPRIYSAWVNGEPVFEDLNLWADHGELVAHTESSMVDVEDGPIEIELVSSSENPMVNAVEIRDEDDPRPDEQHLWLASEYETGDQPDGWEPMAHVEDWGIDEDDDGTYLGLSGTAEERTSLRFAEATEATEMEVWAIAKAVDPAGDYWIYSRGSGEDAPNSELTAPRADDYIAEDSFRLSAYDDGDLTTGETVDHVGVDELYQVRLQVSGDTMRARWWALDGDEPDEWDLEGEAPAEDFGYAGIGHWVGDAYRLYAFGVGTDGASAPSAIPDDLGGPYAGNPAVPPEEALETFELPDGWTIEQVAAEPLLDNPVDVKWDAKGRMWVVEMPDYMDLVPGDGRGGDPPGNYGDWGDAEMSLEEMTGWGDELTDAEPNGAVKILEDTDGDGVMDRATAFAGDLTMSRSLSVLGDGSEALVAHSGSSVESADLFLATDEDGDLEADSTEPVKSSWVNENNPEHTSNGLDYHPNNWLYSANSGDRFRYRGGDLEEASTHGRGQWGIAQDDYGRLYSTHNSNWLMADLVPGNGDYLLRGSSSYSSGVEESVAPDGTVYPVRPVYGTNRSYGPESHRDDGRISSITAISGPGIYRGDAFPEEFKNDAFVPEPKANAVAHFAIEDDANGLGLNVDHEVYDNAEWGEQDFLASSDEVFRPINLTTGPDGALYVVDMYNGVFQHNVFLTDYLAEYYLENNLHEVPPAGRIYRIYPEDAELDDPPALDELGPGELAGQLEDGNGWVRQTAQRLIVQEQVTDAADALREIARESDDPLARMHALWALHGLEEVDADSVFAVFDDVEDSHVLAAAMAAGEPLLGTADAEDYVDYLVGFADADHLRLVVQAAASLGEVADADLQETAEPALEDLLDEYAGNGYVEEAVHSSPEMDFD